MKDIPQICTDLVNHFGLETCLKMIPNRNNTDDLRTKIATGVIYTWVKNHPDVDTISIGEIRDGFEQLEYNLNENRKKIEELYQNG